MARRLAISILTILLGFPGGVARAAEDGQHPTCQQTTERVLEPFLERVRAGLEALIEYEEANRELIASIEDQIDALFDTRLTFLVEQREEEQAHAQKLKWIDEVIADIRRRYAERAAELERQAAEQAAAGREATAEQMRKAAQKVREEVSSGRATGNKKELGRTDSINGWEKYRDALQAKFDERMEQFSKGLMFIRHPDLHMIASWSQILERIEALRERLREAQARLVTHHLPALNMKLNGTDLDALVAERLEALDKVRDEIAKGTFRLHIPTFHAVGDRNGVLELIADAEKKIHETAMAWSAKSYKKFNPTAKSVVTNGHLEEQIARIEKQLSDARDDDARQRLQARIEHYQASLQKHQEVHAEDVRAQRQHIDTTLTWALGETPCGGQGPSDIEARIDRHREQLKERSENADEEGCRLGIYNDYIYEARGGVIHGDPRAAWANALRDTDATDPRSANAGWTENIGLAKNYLKQAKAVFRDLPKFARQYKEFSEATGKLDFFLDEVAKLHLGTKNADDLSRFFQQRRVLRNYFVSQIRPLFKTGALSGQRLDEVIRGMKIHGTVAPHHLRKLEEMRSAANWLQRSGLPRFGRLLQDVEGLDLTNAARLRSAVNYAGDEMLEKVKGDWKKGGLTRACMMLSVADAVGAAYRNTQRGMRPREAVFRAGVNLAIDLVISGHPVTGAAQLAGYLVGGSMYVATGDDAYRQAIPSTVVKQIAQETLDYVASASGEAAIFWERNFSDQPDAEALLDNIDTAQVQDALRRVEQRLDAAPAGDLEVERLLMMRRTLRELLRAKLGMDCDEILARK